MWGEVHLLGLLRLPIYLGCASKPLAAHPEAHYVLLPWPRLELENGGELNCVVLAGFQEEMALGDCQESPSCLPGWPARQSRLLTELDELSLAQC